MKSKWNRFWSERLPIFIVWHVLPKRVVLWAHVCVVSLSGNGPCSCYKETYDLACRKWGLKP